MLSRRSFLGWVATAAPVPFIVARAHAEAVAEVQRGPATLRALADAILPTELGASGIAAEVASFQRWMTGYRESAEANHAYGSSRVRFSGPTPVTTWMRQLDELDAKARATHARAFDALTVDQRQTLVRDVIPAGNAGIADVGGASHVALALLAHFYNSPRATDLCYEAEIGRETCRPLARSSTRPVALRRAGRGS